jgi:hypothetical protein
MKDRIKRTIGGPLRAEPTIHTGRRWVRGGNFRNLQAATIALLAIPISILIVIVNSSSLFRRPPTSGFWIYGQMVPFISGLERFQGGDAPGFNVLTIEFETLFTEEGKTRQNRPVYVALGWLLNRFLSFASFGSYEFRDGSVTAQLNAELGFIVLNIAVLTAAVVILLLLMKPAWGTSWGLIALAVALIVANPVTRVYLWTAHTQIIGITLSIFVIAFCVWIIRPNMRNSTSLLAGILIGLAILAYTSLVLIIGVASFMLLRRGLRKRTMFMLMGAVVPPLAWIAYVTFRTGGYHSEETTNWRQIVWISDAFRDGNLVQSAYRNANDFLVTFADGQTFLAILLLLIALLLVASASDFTLGKTETMTATVASDSAGRRVQLEAVGFLLPLQLAFLYTLGYYQLRLSWTVIVTFAVCVSLVGCSILESRVTPRFRQTANVLLTCFAIFWIVSWTLIPGQWV